MIRIGRARRRRNAGPARTILLTGDAWDIAQVAGELLARGATRIRALSAHPDRWPLPPQVEAVRGDLGSIDVLPMAFDGVEKAYLVPGIEAMQDATAREAIALAAEAGVQHIVDLSEGLGRRLTSLASPVEGSGVPWTHLRADAVTTDALIWADQIRMTGEVCDAHPHAVTAPIDPRDIAAVAAAVLMDETHVGKQYDLTGPEALTRGRMVGEIAAMTGWEIPFTELDHEEAVMSWALERRQHARSYYADLRDFVERPQQVNGVVEEITGRPARTFEQWLDSSVIEFV